MAEDILVLAQQVFDDVNSSAREEDLAAEVVRLRRAFDEAVKSLQGDGSIKFSACEWCGVNWPKTEADTYETIRQRAREHVFACAQHPMKIERDQLRAGLDHAISENLAFNVKVAAEINEARAQRDAMRPVVDAAVAALDHIRSSAYFAAGGAEERARLEVAMDRAVDVYRKSKEST